MLHVPWLMPYMAWFFDLEAPRVEGRDSGNAAHHCQRCAVRALPGSPLCRGGESSAIGTRNSGCGDVGIVAVALVFFVFGDKDVLIFLPLAAIAVAKQTEPVLLKHRRAVFVACLLLLAGSAVWTREDLLRNQAVWTLAERVHAGNVPSEKIYAGWEWYGFHHFDDYARAVPPVATTEFADFFGPWMDRQRAQAEYLIVHDPEPPPGERYETVGQFRYFSVFSRGFETFYAVKRTNRPERLSRGRRRGGGRLGRTLTRELNRPSATNPA